MAGTPDRALNIKSIYDVSPTPTEELEFRTISEEEWNRATSDERKKQRQNEAARKHYARKKAKLEKLKRLQSAAPTTGRQFQPLYEAIGGTLPQPVNSFPEDVDPTTQDNNIPTVPPRDFDAPPGQLTDDTYAPLEDEDPVLASQEGSPTLERPDSPSRAPPTMPSLHEATDDLESSIASEDLPAAAEGIEATSNASVPRHPTALYNDHSLGSLESELWSHPSTGDSNPDAWSEEAESVAATPGSQRVRGRSSSVDSVTSSASNDCIVMARELFRRARETKSAARMLMYQLLAFQGCSAAQHETSHRIHTTEFREAGTKHGTFEDIIRPTVTPPVLHVSEKPEATRFTKLSEPAAFQRLLEGRDDTDGGRPHLCIHTEHDPSPPRVPATVHYDIDSCLGFVTTLGAFKANFQMYPRGPKGTRQDSPLHLHHTGIAPPRGSQASDVVRNFEPQKMAHIHFGQVWTDKHPFDVFVFFPALQESSKSTYLTNKQLDIWYTRIVRPSVLDVLPDDISSQYPPTLTVTDAHASAASDRLTLSFAVEAAYLDGLWLAIEKKIKEPRNREFAGATLFFTAKNTKKVHLNADPLKCLQNFAVFLNRVFDRTKTYDVIRDLAKSTNNPTQKSRTFLYRKCCLETFAKEAGWEKSARYYNHVATRDMINMTVDTPVRGALGKAQGLFYAQFYSTFRSAMDHTQNYPFADDQLDKLATGATRTARYDSVGRTRTALGPLWTKYGRDKNHVHVSLTDSVDERYVSREEYRINGVLNSQLVSALEAHSRTAFSWDLSRHQGAVAYQPLWSLQTKRLLTFQYHVINAACAAYEAVHAAVRLEPDNEQSRVLDLLMQYIRVLPSASNYPSKTALWLRERERQGQLQRGLGFQSTMLRFGFCWFTQVIDWRHYVFKRRYSEQMYVYPDRAIFQYHARREQVAQHCKWSRHIEACRSALRECSHFEFQELVCQDAVDIILREYRYVLGQLIKKDFIRDVDDDLAADKVSYSFDGLASLYPSGAPFLGPTRLWNGSPAKVLDMIFGQLDQTIRYEAGPYRNTHGSSFRQLAWDFLSDFCRLYTGQSPQAVFESKLYLSACRQHFLLPSFGRSESVLCNTGGVRGAGRKQRMWLSVAPTPSATPSEGINDPEVNAVWMVQSPTNYVRGLPTLPDTAHLPLAELQLRFRRRMQRFGGRSRSPNHVTTATSSSALSNI